MAAEHVSKTFNVNRSSNIMFWSVLTIKIRFLITEVEFVSLLYVSIFVHNVSS